MESLPEKLTKLALIGEGGRKNGWTEAEENYPLNFLKALLAQPKKSSQIYSNEQITCKCFNWGRDAIVSIGRQKGARKKATRLSLISRSLDTAALLVFSIRSKNKSFTPRTTFNSWRTYPEVKFNSPFYTQSCCPKSVFLYVTSGWRGLRSRETNVMCKKSN